MSRPAAIFIYSIAGTSSFGRVFLSLLSSSLLLPSCSECVAIDVATQPWRSVWKAPFSCFLPLALEPAHFERAIPALRRAAQQAFGEAAATTTLLDLLAAAMNSMVVDLFKCCEEAAPPLHASEAALEGYCALHQLLLCSAHRWPEISAEAYRRVR